MTEACSVRNSTTSRPYHPVIVDSSSFRSPIRYAWTFSPPVFSNAVRMPANCCSAFSLQASPLFAPVICLSVRVTKSIAAPVSDCWCAIWSVSFLGSSFVIWAGSIQPPSSLAARLRSIISS